VGLVGARLELRVELGRHKEGVRGEFHDLHEPLVGGDRGNDEPGLLDLVLIIGVELVAVAMAFPNALGSAVKLRGLGAGEDDRLAGTEAHRGTEVADALLLLLEANDRMGGALVELGGVGALQTADIPGILDGGHLHAEADSEEGNAGLPRIPSGQDLAFNAAIAKAAGDEDALDLADDLRGVGGVDRFGIHADDVDLGGPVDAGVDE
jgi:hypothetical protein